MTLAELTFVTSILAPVVAAQKTADGDLPGWLFGCIVIAAIALLLIAFGLHYSGWLNRTNDPGQRINLGERRDPSPAARRYLDRLESMTSDPVLLERIRKQRGGGQR